MNSYKERLEQFRSLLEKEWNERHTIDTGTIHIQPGYKFDKVYLVTENKSRTAIYMVEHNTENIFGVKSWTQVNMRRAFGTLATASQWDWGLDSAIPIKGSEAEKQHLVRESTIKSGHKKRGRKPKAAKLGK